MSNGRIFNIQKCSIHDGKGMRTTVFFKGCGLHCIWCANPESIHPSPELSYNEKICIKCGLCTKVCPSRAIEVQSDDLGTFDFKRVIFKKDMCIGCGKCSEVCCMDARHKYGDLMGVDELFAEIYKDHFYFQHSGGGVTFSGGEVLLQPEFLKEICAKCKRYGINTAIETCGFADYEKFKEALKYIDYIYFDIKHMDSERHKLITGQSNERILYNLQQIDDWNIGITIRTPIVPGYNDDLENIRRTAGYISTIRNVRSYELLAYHQLGINKYQALGRKYELTGIESPSLEHMLEIKEVANSILEPVGKACIYDYKNNGE